MAIFPCENLALQRLHRRQSAQHIRILQAVELVRQAHIGVRIYAEPVRRLVPLRLEVPQVETRHRNRSVRLPHHPSPFRPLPAFASPACRWPQSADSAEYERPCGSWQSRPAHPHPTGTSYRALPASGSTSRCHRRAARHARRTPSADAPYRPPSPSSAGPPQTLYLFLALLHKVQRRAALAVHSRDPQRRIYIQPHHPHPVAQHLHRRLRRILHLPVAVDRHIQTLVGHLHPPSVFFSSACCIVYATHVCSSTSLHVVSSTWSGEAWTVPSGSTRNSTFFPSARSPCGTMPENTRPCPPLPITSASNAQVHVVAHVLAILLRQVLGRIAHTLVRRASSTRRRLADLLRRSIRKSQHQRRELLRHRVALCQQLQRALLVSPPAPSDRTAPCPQTPRPSPVPPPAHRNKNRPARR